MAKQVIPTEERFWRQVDKTGGPDACWPWIGYVTASSISSGGYGRFSVGSRTDGTRAQVPAHQWVFEHSHNSEIPTDAATGKKVPVDHVCHNEAAARGECDGGPTCPHRRCVNPAHLVLTTLADNTLSSSVTTASVNAAKETCPAGHKFSHRSGGQRVCRRCKTEQQRKRRQRRKELACP